MRLEKVWTEMQGLIPSGIAFVESAPEGRRYQELTRSYRDISGALPAVSGFRITSIPMGLNEIARARLDAADSGELSIDIALDEELDQPSREIAEYRSRFERTRRELVRDQVARLTREVNQHLGQLTALFPVDMEQVQDERWDLVGDAVRQIERLAGGHVPRAKAWSDLIRHLHFGQGQDLHAIARTDWPKVRSDLQQNLYSELEPLPVVVPDLGETREGKA